MRRILCGVLVLLLTLSLAACSTGEGEKAVGQIESTILVAYDSGQADDAVARAAAVLEEKLGGSLVPLSEAAGLDMARYEFVLLGFAAEGNVLPESVEMFLESHDFGARTIFPFVLGDDNEAGAVFSAISQLQPGALLGSSALLFSQDTAESEIAEWADGLEISHQGEAPRSGRRRRQYGGVCRGDAG